MVLCSLVSVSCLVFCSKWSGVLVISHYLAPVGCFCCSFVACKTSGILGTNFASAAPSTCWASRILGICLISGIPTYYSMTSRTAEVFCQGCWLEYAAQEGVQLGDVEQVLVDVS